MPELEVRFWPEPGNRADIDVIACGWLPEGEFKTFPNLKLIVSLLAGPDHLLHDPAVPKHVPIVRAGDPAGDTMMNEVTLAACVAPPPQPAGLCAGAAARRMAQSAAPAGARAQGRRHGAWRHRHGGGKKLAVNRLPGCRLGAYAAQSRRHRGFLPGATSCRRSSSAAKSW